ncbi:ComEC/Rec2 family competence protein [Lentisphaera profundi]|uniref:ComEC/Rec2 family competence protein n=1 Tax=Lentisphaera profundi TaxID=1658616 RepID=A0ABY7VYZ7_9BACT|nr:ComEC/Rec2 family competence protein [Lentisphaera profundi]WDE98489.1 ComEC/Rec2 family competence protein [Lentisphaera profundi]
MSIDCHAYPLERAFWSFIAGLMIFLSFQNCALIYKLIFLSILCTLFIYKKSYRLLFPLFLGLAWGFFFQQSPPDHFHSMGGKLEASIIDKQIVNGHTSRREIQININSFESHGGLHLSNFKALFIKPKDTLFNYNDQLITTGSLIPLVSSLDHESGYINHLHQQGFYWKFIPNSPEDIQINPRACFNKSILKSRDQFLLRLSTQLNSEREYQILAAMLFGLKQELTSIQKDTLRKSGLMHIFAVSGLHVGIVSLIILLLMRLFCIPVWWRFSLLPLLLIPYLIMTGIPASALRAWIMISVWSIGICLKKSSVSLNSLYCAAFVILLINPNELLLVGFQFSFLVIFALLLSMDKLDRFCEILDEKIQWGLPFSYHRHHLKNKFIKAFGITVVAYLSSLAMNIYLSANTNPFSLAINLICIFLAAPLISCALLSSVFTPLIPLLKVFTGFFAGLASLSAQFSLKLGTLSGLHCLLYTAIFLLILRLRIKSRLQVRLIAVLIFCFLILLQIKPKEDSIIIFRSSGQEQLCLVLFKDDESLLVNASDFQSSSFIIKKLDERAINKSSILICDNRKNSSLGCLSLLNKKRLHSLSFLNPRTTPTQFQKYLQQIAFDNDCPLYFDLPRQSKITKISDQCFLWNDYKISLTRPNPGRINLKITKNNWKLERSFLIANFHQVETYPLK